MKFSTVNTIGYPVWSRLLLPTQSGRAFCYLLSLIVPVPSCLVAPSATYSVLSRILLVWSRLLVCYLLRLRRNRHQLLEGWVSPTTAVTSLLALFALIWPFVYDILSSMYEF